MSKTEGDEAKLVSRRSVVQAAAWSMPVIAFAAAAPLASASPQSALYSFQPKFPSPMPGATETSSPSAFTSSTAAGQPKLVISDPDSSWNTDVFTLIFTYTGTDANPDFFFRSFTSPGVIAGSDTALAYGDTMYAYDGVYQWSVIGISSKVVELTCTGMNVTAGVPLTVYLPHLKVTYSSVSTVQLSITTSVIGTLSQPF